MRQPEQLDPNAFVYQDFDESGNPRIMVIQEPPVPYRRMTVLARTVDTPADRRAAWTINSCCINCQCWIESPDLAALVPTNDGPRLACREKCFAQAMDRHVPTLHVRKAAGTRARRQVATR